MDSQSWASALKQVRATIDRWPILVFLPLGLILPRYPHPWGLLFALIIIGLSVVMGFRSALQTHRILKRQAEAERIESQCRQELFALTVEMQAVFERQMKAIIEGQPGAAEEAKRELEEIYAAQKRVMDKWKSSETPGTK